MVGSSALLLFLPGRFFRSFKRILPTSAMKSRSNILFSVLPILLLQLFPPSHSLQVVNITVIGTVFCDMCSNNTFTKYSYFLQGAKVEIECSFRVDSESKDEIVVTVERRTDRFGVYKLEIPAMDGFECRQGREIESFCRARLVGSSSPACNVPGLSSSSEHLALKLGDPRICVYTLNALNYRPSKKDAAAVCEEEDGSDNTLVKDASSSLFFWPPFPPFSSWRLPSWPWPFPFPCPIPPALPFPFPPMAPVSIAPPVPQNPSLFPLPPFPSFSPSAPYSATPKIPFPWFSPPSHSDLPNQRRGP